MDGLQEKSLLALFLSAFTPVLYKPLSMRSYGRGKGNERLGRVLLANCHPVEDVFLERISTDSEQ